MYVILFVEKFRGSLLYTSFVDDRRSYCNRFLETEGIKVYAFVF
jgi:hypothetical protein